MNILIIDPDEARAALVVEGLKQDPHINEASVFHYTQFELIKLKELNPDMVIIACECPDRDTLDALSIANELIPRPVVMFVDRSDANTTARALEAGVAAYIVDGFKPARISSVLEVAAHRFSLMQTLRADLSQAKADLAARKVIDRAKGVLMRARSLSEDEAYRLLRKHAMDQGKTMAVVAQDILKISSLLDGGE